MKLCWWWEVQIRIMIVTLGCLKSKSSETCWNFSYLPINVMWCPRSSGMWCLVTGWVVPDILRQCSGLNFKGHCVQWRNVSIKNESSLSAWHHSLLSLCLCGGGRCFITHSVNLSILWMAKASWCPAVYVAGCTPEPVWMQLWNVKSIAILRIRLWCWNS
jgi:hypothetical protein